MGITAAKIFRQEKRLGTVENVGRHSRRLIFILGTCSRSVLLPFNIGAYHVHNSKSDLFDNGVNHDYYQNLYLDNWKDTLPQRITSFIDEIQAGNLHTTSYR
nr:AIF_HP1_G0030590.mRNA.1.CDS.1 [Saccharomyces cerevisiae]